MVTNLCDSHDIYRQAAEEFKKSIIDKHGVKNQAQNALGQKEEGAARACYYRLDCAFSTNTLTRCAQVSVVFK